MFQDQKPDHVRFTPLLTIDGGTKRLLGTGVDPEGQVAVLVLAIGRLTDRRRMP
jgi:hypothetical protein